MRYLLRLLGICLLLLIPFFACLDFGDGETEGCGPYVWDWDDGDPCQGVVCPRDDNVCTEEYCSGGLCKSRPVTNGMTCTYDGLAGVCVEGVCGENLCEGVNCDDEPCSEGKCDYVDGLCDYTARLANGTPCTYDGLEGVCVGGVCGENLCEDVNCDDGDACTEDTCDYVDGTCDFTPVVCDDYEECTEDSCDPTDGCIFTGVEDGTECGGTSGVCEAGACVGPCDFASDEEYQCPIEGFEDLFCCPGYQYCRGSCSEYTHDFESLDRASITALSEDGWLVFGEVVDGSGVFKFNYGPFPAPNGGPAFSAIVTGEGGPDQGAQQLGIYNDYNCCDPPNQGHFNGTDRATSLVFQQPFTLGNPISADDVGKTLEFSFEAKRGNINDPTGDTTAQAFIQTVDPNAGFAQTNFVSIDTTNLPVGIWDRYSISLTIDAGLMGQYLEFGFLNTASNFEPSGVFYDNILFETGAGGSGGTGGTGGSGGSGGTGGTGGVGGMTGANPVITNIAWATVGACTQGTASDYTITITATDADNDPTDLMYIGDVPGCLGAIDGAVSTIICPNVAPFPGTVVAEDPGGNTSLPARFTIGVCETGDCATNPGACEL